MIGQSGVDWARRMELSDGSEHDADTTHDRVVTGTRVLDREDRTKLSHHRHVPRDGNIGAELQLRGEAAVVELLAEISAQRRRLTAARRLSEVAGVQKVAETAAAVHRHARRGRSREQAPTERPRPVVGAHRGSLSPAEGTVGTAYGLVGEDLFLGVPPFLEENPEAEIPCRIEPDVSLPPGGGEIEIAMQRRRETRGGANADVSSVGVLRRNRTDSDNEERREGWKGKSC